MGEASLETIFSKGEIQARIGLARIECARSKNHAVGDSRRRAIWPCRALLHANSIVPLKVRDRQSSSEWFSRSSLASITRRCRESYALLSLRLNGGQSVRPNFNFVTRPFTTQLSVLDGRHEDIRLAHPRVGLECVYTSWQTVRPLSVTATSCPAIILTQLCSHGPKSRILAYITNETELRLNNAATSAKQASCIQLRSVETRTLPLSTHYWSLSQGSGHSNGHTSSA